MTAPLRITRARRTLLESVRFLLVAGIAAGVGFVAGILIGCVFGGG